MDPATIRLAPHQKKAVECQHRFTWNNWARQAGGKSFTFALRRLLRGYMRKRDQIFLSAGERQCRELIGKVKMHIKAMQIASEEQEFMRGAELQSLQVIIPGRFKIIGLPANPDTARGYTGDVFLDEFAIHQQDREIWASIFPTVLREKGELDVASTPKGARNVFAALRENDLFHKTTVTIYDAIANGLQVNAEEMRTGCIDEDIWRQEFLCEFIDGASTFLKLSDIAGTEDATLPLTQLPEQLGKLKNELFIGVDIGRKHDLTVIWVISKDGDIYTTRSIVVLDRMPFREQYQILQELLSLRNLVHCQIDSTGLGLQIAETAEEDFGARRVTAVNFTLHIKNRLAMQLRTAIEGGQWKMPIDKTVCRDFSLVRKDVTTHGIVRISAPVTDIGHGDRFWAAALALDAGVGYKMPQLAIASAGMKSVRA